MIEVNGVQVDEQRANRLLKKIIIAETQNRAKQAGDLEMAKKIKKMLEDEVECY